MNDLSATATDRIRRVGIVVFNESGDPITENAVGGIETNESADAIGIGVGTQGMDNATTTGGGVTNASVSSNRINGRQQPEHDRFLRGRHRGGRCGGRRQHDRRQHDLGSHLAGDVAGHRGGNLRGGRDRLEHPALPQLGGHDRRPRSRGQPGAELRARRDRHRPDRGAEGQHLLHDADRRAAAGGRQELRHRHGDDHLRQPRLQLQRVLQSAAPTPAASAPAR